MMLIVSVLMLDSYMPFGCFLAEYIWVFFVWRSALTIQSFFSFYFFSLLFMAISTSGGRTARRVFEFGRTYVVRPKGRHQATVVWLHGLGDNGSR